MAVEEAVDVEAGVAALLEGVLWMQLAERRLESSILNALGLSQSDVLALALLARDAGMKVGRLAMHLDITPGSASLLVSRLVAAGLVRRVPCPTDRRSVCLEATRRGIEVSRAVRAQYAAAVRAAADTATVACLVTTAGVLRSTAQHLGAEADSAGPALLLAR